MPTFSYGAPMTENWANKSLLPEAETPGMAWMERNGSLAMTVAVCWSSLLVRVMSPTAGHSGDWKISAWTSTFSERWKLSGRRVMVKSFACDAIWLVSGESKDTEMER